jgi:hypothetical protein
MTKIDACDVCLLGDNPVIKLAVRHGRTVLKGNPIKFCNDHRADYRAVNNDGDKVLDLLNKASGGANLLLRNAIKAK